LQELAQLFEDLKIHPRIAELHRCAGCSIEHPSRNDDHVAGLNLDMNDVA